uniref:Uncharacterized protein n=1 Tax=Arundo donax TaxID=35708 RepID=A0A0A9GW38_ARUDO
MRGCGEAAAAARRELKERRGGRRGAEALRSAEWRTAAGFGANRGGGIQPAEQLARACLCPLFNSQSASHIGVE